MRRAFKAGRGRGKTGASDPTTDPLRSRETSESRIHPRAPVDEVRRRDSGFPHEGGGREPRDEEEEEERRGQRRLMVMVASQCLSGRRRSRYIFTSSWSTYALAAFSSRFRDISKEGLEDRSCPLSAWKRSPFEEESAVSSIDRGRVLRSSSSFSLPVSELSLSRSLPVGTSGSDLWRRGSSRPYESFIGAPWLKVSTAL